MGRLDARFLKKFQVDETPSGTVNGSNVTFTLANTPHESESVDVFVDGLKMRSGVDYTFTGVTITFTTAPALGQSIEVNYFRNTGE